MSDEEREADDDIYDDGPILANEQCIVCGDSVAWDGSPKPMHLPRCKQIYELQAQLDTATRTVKAWETAAATGMSMDADAIACLRARVAQLTKGAAQFSP